MELQSVQQKLKAKNDLTYLQATQTHFTRINPVVLSLESEAWKK